MDSQVRHPTLELLQETDSRPVLLKKAAWWSSSKSSPQRLNLHCKGKDYISYKTPSMSVPKIITSDQHLSEESCSRRTERGKVQSDQKNNSNQPCGAAERSDNIQFNSDYVRMILFAARRSSRGCGEHGKTPPAQLRNMINKCF